MEESKATRQKFKPEYTHDFFTVRRLLFLACGYAETRSPFYLGYMVFMMVFHCYVQYMSAYACYLVAPNRVLIIEALHTMLVSVFSAFGLILRYQVDRKLHNAQAMIKAGVYLYEDEDIDENQEKMLEVVPSEIERKSSIFVVVFSICTASNMIFFPLSQLVMLDLETFDNMDGLLNPYMPQFIYSPVSTWTWYGYTFNYLLSGQILLYIYGTATCMNDIYISCTVQLKAHLQVLNYSIKNIEKRAYNRYLRTNNYQQQSIDEDLLGQRDYQNCLYQCLRANIKHHLALVAFRNEFMAFTGACLTAVNVLATVIYASVLYLIYQKFAINYVINFIVTLLCEQTYTFYICVYGQEIIEESSNVFQNLYSIRWIYYGRRFNKTLQIMMCNTMRPMLLNALIISSAACLETYGDIITAVYKLMNLVKHSDDRKAH